MKQIMFTSILFIFCLFFTIQSNANDWRKDCGELEKLAEAIMTGRQTGVPMSKMMEISSSDETFRKLVENFIIVAYESPRYSSEEMQRKSIDEFRDQVYLECVKTLKEKE